MHLIDRSYEQLDRAKAGMLESLKKLASKGKIREGDVEATLERVKPDVDMEVGR